jgi:hypothetical protein
MFDESVKQKPKGRRPRWRKRKNLPFWGMLSIWLAMSTGFAIYNWFLVKQDERIAPKEQVALGSIYKSTNGRRGPRVFYTFPYDGKQYHGDDSIAYGSTVSSHVAVYFDPDDPTTNNLVEYRHKSKQDHEIMIGCGYAAAVLAALLAFVLWIQRSGNQSKENYSIV